MAVQIYIAHVRDWRNRQTIRQAYLVYPDDEWERLPKMDEQYTLGEREPHYPVPSMAGPVSYYADDFSVEMIIKDCDETFDPRLCIAVLKSDGFVLTDYPHNSPNYR